MARDINFGKMLHGGDYNPEQWLHDPEIFEQDLQLLKQAKINEVSLGIFSWAVLEPEEGVYCFEWMENILNRLHENGISVILATPSAARPRWMAQKYPEVLRVNDTGHRYLYGERHNHCYTSPVYREKTRKINTELANRFKDHPAVIAWHISNEFGGDCYCPLCIAEFRKWLKNKYQTVDKMNHAWATTFWSHLYNDFDQVDAPSRMGDSSLHGLNLDWRRFVTDRTVDFVKHEIKALRDAGSDKPTTINMMYNFGGLNYHKFADVVDFVSWDSYPVWHKKAEHLTAMDNGMQHDIMRTIQKKPFLLMESCPSSTNWQPISKLKKPGMLHAASLQAVAHGSDSVLYFQIRQSQGSSEKFHGAVIDHYGKADTRVFGEITRVGESLEQLQQVTGANTKAQVAVVYDWENRWAVEDAAGPRNQGVFYKECVEKSYFAFRKQGLDVDMIDMEQDLSGYKIVAAPMLYMFRAGFEEKVRAFVEQGGTFVLTYWSGIVDETDLCFLGGTPHGLMDVMGLRSTEIDGLFDWESNTGIPEQNNCLNLTKNYSCTNLCELVNPSTAETLMTYGDDFYAGMPALTKNNFGAGKAYHVCADFEQAFYDEFYAKLVKEAGVTLVLSDIPDGVLVNTRENENGLFVFVQNFNPKEVEIALPLTDYKVIVGEYNGKIQGFDTVVLKKA